MTGSLIGAKVGVGSLSISWMGTFKEDVRARLKPPALRSLWVKDAVADGEDKRGEGDPTPSNSPLQGDVAEEVGHGFTVVGSSDGLCQDHGNVNDLKNRTDALPLP